MAKLTRVPAVLLVGERDVRSSTTLLFLDQSARSARCAHTSVVINLSNDTTNRGNVITTNRADGKSLVSLEEAFTLIGGLLHFAAPKLPEVAPTGDATICGTPAL